MLSIEVIALVISFFALFYLFFSNQIKNGEEELKDPITALMNALQKEQSRHVKPSSKVEAVMPPRQKIKKKPLEIETLHFIVEAEKPPRGKAVLKNLHSSKDMVIVADILDKPKSLRE
ncbi:MAG: hypothetical protein LW832_00245 [Parachlamydia sp.]|jgi:hypothetical protein|nr:hypothetical protein [Parachlamydia sp.]